LFNQSGCLTVKAMQNFLNGALKPSGMVLVKNHLKNCRLCAEALEGYRSQYRKDLFDKDVKKLSGRIRQRFLLSPVHPLQRRLPLLISLSVAATIIILIGLFFIFVQQQVNQQNLAEKKLVEKELVALSPKKDTINILVETKKVLAYNNKKVMPQKKVEKFDILPDETQVAQIETEAKTENIEPVITTESPIADLNVEDMAASKFENAPSGKNIERSKSKKVRSYDNYQQEVSSGDMYEERAFVVVDEMPKFMNGDVVEFQRYVQANLSYPKKAIENNIQGRVMISFVIDENGKLIHSKVVRSADPILDAEAMRVVNASPIWKPGRQSGKKVKVQYIIPVVFRLN
jgi:TonB family protein